MASTSDAQDILDVRAELLQEIEAMRQDGRAQATTYAVTVATVEDLPDRIEGGLETHAATVDHLRKSEALLDQFAAEVQASHNLPELRSVLTGIRSRRARLARRVAARGKG